MYRIISSTARKVGVEEIEAQSLRKSFGYYCYKETEDIAFLMDVYNHSSPVLTLRYIGINQDEIVKRMSRFHLQTK